MNLSPYVEELRRHLLSTAAAGGPEAAALADRMIAPLEASLRLILLQALSDAAAEITVDLAPSSVEVRLRSGEPEFVVARAPAAADAQDWRGFSRAHGQGPTAAGSGPNEGEEGGTARITLRLLDHLKVKLENAAAVEGLSVNAWLVRTLASATDAVDRSGQAAARSPTGQRYTGWLR